VQDYGFLFLVVDPGALLPGNPFAAVGFPSASNATPGGNASPVSAASNSSPHISDAVPMSNDRPLGRRKAEHYRVGAESRPGCAGRHDVRRAAGGVHTDESGIDDPFEVMGVAPAEIAVVDADRRDPGLSCLGDRDFGTDTLTANEFAVSAVRPLSSGYSEAGLAGAPAGQCRSTGAVGEGDRH
jgi:hypothetical protein